MTPTSTLKIIALLGCFFSGVAQATVVESLYEVTLPCESQADSERQELFKKGMQEVLTRVSIEPEPNRYPAVSAALDRAVDFVERYGYAEGAIHIRYNPDAIRPLIQQTGQMAWGQSRPSVIVWLAIEEQQQRRLIGQETDPALQAKLIEMAKQRGVPIVLPQMDLEDLSAVSTGDLWGTFPTTLQQASLRYGAQAILAGRLQLLADGRWQASWQWISDQAPSIWENSGQSLDGLIADGFDRMTTQFKDHYATKPTPVNQAAGSAQKPILIGVANVRSVEDFVKVEAYLEGLDSVSSVNLLQVLGDRAIFEVLPRSHQSTQMLMQAINLDRQLTSLGSQEPNFQEVDMAYRFVS
jgi:uncharacterized protein